MNGINMNTGMRTSLGLAGLVFFAMIALTWLNSKKTKKNIKYRT